MISTVKKGSVSVDALSQGSKIVHRQRPHALKLQVHRLGGGESCSPAQ